MAVNRAKEMIRALKGALTLEQSAVQRGGLPE